MNSTTNITSDRIEKQITLKAPRSRVWRALSDVAEFGAWFGARLQGQMLPKARVTGIVSGCGHGDVAIEIHVESVQPEHLLSYRWHPYAVDPKVDYSTEPMTLVEFRLEEIPGGTRLTVIESGFDKVPASRRAEAFRMNDGGWTAQIRNIERYVSTN